MVGTALAFLCATAPASAVGLYDQYDNAATAFRADVNSQDFETANDAYDDNAADDFVVPAGQTWRITGVDVDGEFTGNSGPPQSFNVYFYRDSSNLPSDSILANRAGSSYVAGPQSGDYSITLTSPITLDSGTYWVSVQARQDTSAGNWYWHARTTQSHQGAAWQNGGGLWNYGCQSWTRTTSCAGLQVSGPDLVFRLSGAIVPNYTPRTAQGAQIVPGTTDVGSHCDDCLVPVTFPFPVTLYGSTYTAGKLDSNGILQFGTEPTGTSHDCSPDLSVPAVMPYWANLTTAPAGDGIYTTTTGTAPHRTFVIEWRTDVGTPHPGTANFEIQIHEGSQTITTVYGATSDQGASAVSGVTDGLSGPWKNFSCDKPNLTNHLNVDYVFDAKTLTVAKSGSGAGTVTSNPAGISCSATCSAKFSNDDQVTLRATPSSGSKFTGWSGGGCSGAGTCEITMSSDRTVNAEFTKPPGTKISKVRLTNGNRSVALGFHAILAPEDAGARVTFKCELIRGQASPGYTGCTSPAKYKHLKPGHYVFKVRAVSGALKDPTPAMAQFRIKH